MPTGTVVIVGKLLVVRLLLRMIELPTIGPSMLTLLPSSTLFVP